MTISSNNKQNIGKDESTYKIITDEPAKDAPDFRKYSERLSHIIENSTARFTVGIFGGWGTGKTTMMQMIKNQLESTVIISWKNIEQDSEKNVKSLINYSSQWQQENIQLEINQQEIKEIIDDVISEVKESKENKDDKIKK